MILTEFRVKRASINKAHETLASFSLQQIRDDFMPSNIGSSFTLVTQNVDGLSQQALDLFTQGMDQEPVFNSTSLNQPPLLEMHGRLFEVVCTASGCGHVAYNTDSPICPALADTELDIVGNQKEKFIQLRELPRCTECGSLARPGVVWFGEMPRHLEEIDKLVSKADLCIVVGTSSTVC